MKTVFWLHGHVFSQDEQIHLSGSKYILQFFGEKTSGLYCFKHLFFPISSFSIPLSLQPTKLLQQDILIMVGKKSGSITQVVLVQSPVLQNDDDDYGRKEMCFLWP
jgi:hypothetical protein